MVVRSESTHRRQQRLTLGDFVRREVPHLRIASMSQPEPELARHNVVAATRDIDAARSAVLALEALEADDAKLGLVVLSTDGEADLVDGRADPEGVTRMVASRTLAGGTLGAVAGALLIGGADCAVRQRQRIDRDRGGHRRSHHRRSVRGHLGRVCRDGR